MNKLLAIFLFFPLFANAAAPSASISVGGSRTSGVAPLCVQFDGSGSTDGDMTATNEEFHGLSYFWNFGDSGAGTHTNGSRLASKNVAYDPITGHCFDTSATVTLTVCDETSCSKATQAITVTSANAQWATGKTTCVSTSGTFTDCPTVVSGDYASVAACQSASKCLTQSTTPTITSDMRVALRGGETFTGTMTVAADDTGPGLITSYGAGRATVSVTTTAECFTVSATDWRIVNIHCAGDSSNARTATSLTAAGTKMTIKDSKFTGFGAASYTTIEGGNNSSAGEDFSFVGNEISGGHATQGAESITSYLLRGVIIGNQIAATQTQFHPIRIYPDASVVANNTITGGGKSGQNVEAIGIRPSGAIGAVTRSKIVLSENKVRVGPSFTFTFLKVQSGNPAAYVDQEITDLLVQRNYIDFAVGSSAGIECMRVGGTRITIRNNICDMTNSGDEFIRLNKIVDAGAAPDYVKVYNNTVYASTDVGAGFTFFNSNSLSSTNSNVVNNLSYIPLPSGTTTRVIVNGVVATDSNNSTGSSGTNQIKLTDPFLSTPSSSNYTTYQPSTAYADDGGTAAFPATGLFGDFFGCHDKTGANRIGAIVPRASAICAGAP